MAQGLRSEYWEFRPFSMAHNLKCKSFLPILYPDSCIYIWETAIQNKTRPLAPPAEARLKYFIYAWNFFEQKSLVVLLNKYLRVFNNDIHWALHRFHIFSPNTKHKQDYRNTVSFIQHGIPEREVTFKSSSYIGPTFHIWLSLIKFDLHHKLVKTNITKKRTAQLTSA